MGGRPNFFPGRPGRMNTIHINGQAIDDYPAVSRILQSRFPIIQPETVFFNDLPNNELYFSRTFLVVETENKIVCISRISGSNSKLFQLNENVAITGQKGNRCYQRTCRQTLLRATFDKTLLDDIVRNNIRHMMT